MRGFSPPLTRRIRLHKAGVAVRQVHRKEVDLPLHPPDHRQRLAKVRLRMSRIVPQRHEYLALTLTLTLRQHVILRDGQTAAIVMLVAQTLENPLRRVTLLRRPALILFQNPVNHPHEGVQLRTHRRSAAPVTRWHRERHHLRHRPGVNAKTTRRLAPEPEPDDIKPANDNRGPDGQDDETQRQLDQVVLTIARLIGRRIAREQFAALSADGADKD